MDADDKKNVIDVWKTVVQVQQHFNDIEMKIRGIFITMVLALIAAQGFVAEKHLSYDFGSVQILYATFVPMLGIIGTNLFYFMDKHWYHRLLVGAVKHGIKIEEKYKQQLPELNLSASIGEASPIHLRGWLTRKIAAFVVSDPKYKETGRLHSDGKIELFYKSIVWLFVIIFFFTLLFAGVLICGEPLFFFFIHALFKQA
jgi:hypothetical protein